MSEVVLEVQNLAVHFPIPGGLLRRPIGYVSAVDGVSFSVGRGETLGLVGESGCGKSTIAHAILQLVAASSGRVLLNGEDISGLSPRELRVARRSMQMVFQDPYSSLSPRMTVNEIVAEPLRIHGLYKQVGRERVEEALRLVGLGSELGSRYAQDFSGGQRQRVGIARSLVLDPDLLILDEPVSALDVSIQAQIVNLLQDLQERLELSFLLISHDLSVIHHACHRVAVMYLGKLVELGDRDEIFSHPRHPYTSALLSAVPIDDPRRRRERERIVLEGDVPDPSDPPSGCRFRTRCWKAEEICAVQEPPLLAQESTTHIAACHFPEDAARLDVEKTR